MAAVVAPAWAGPPIQAIGGGFGFPSSAPAGRTVIRVAVDPRGAGDSTSVLTVVECYRGTCKFASPATTGFVQAVFAVAPNVGAREPVLVVACSRLGCVKAVRTVKIWPLGGP